MPIPTQNFREYHLDNGLHVLLQETPTQTVAARLRVNFGAVNENPGEEGLAHLLEHALIRAGSKRFTPTEVDKITSKFGYYNASTGLAETNFPVDMLSEHTEAYLNFIADISAHPTIDAARFEEERQRVLRELSDSKAGPTYRDKTDYNTAIFGKDAPQLRSILGKEKVVAQATREDMLGFHQRGYGASNMDLIIVGALPRNIEELVQHSFAEHPRGAKRKFEFPRPRKLQEQIILDRVAPELYNQDNPQESNAALSIGFTGPTETDEDVYAVGMLSSILGGDSNSRVFERVSRRMGLAYHISSAYNTGLNSGNLWVGGSIKATRVDDAINAIFDEMQNLIKKPVSQSELERIKLNARYCTAKTFENNQGHVNAIQGKLDYGINPEERLKLIDAVTPQEVQLAARKYLPSSREDGHYVMLIRNPLS